MREGQHAEHISSPDVVTESVQSEHDTQQIIKHCQEGDRKACGALYHLYEKFMYSYAHKFFNNHHDTQDFVQEIFHRLFSGKLQQYTPQEGASFKAWLTRVLRNAAINTVRDPRRKLVFIEGGSVMEEDMISKSRQSPQTPEEIVGDRRMIRKVAEWLHDPENGVTDPQKRVGLAILRGVTEYKDIARETGLPLGTVMSALFRLRIKLEAKFPGALSLLAERKNDNEQGEHVGNETV